MRLPKKKTTPVFTVEGAHDRINSVIGPGINWHGDLRGRGGVRIEGTLEGEIAIRGMVVVGETGKVTCQTLQTDHLIVAGAVKGDIICEKLEIRSTGRIWGDVVTASFTSEDGAFMSGKMRMEEKIALDLDPETGMDSEDSALEADPPEGPSPEVGPASQG